MIDIRVKGIKPAQGFLSRLFQNMGMKRALARASEGIEDLFGHNLRAKRFRRLSAEYARWKQRRFPGRPILVLSGRMMDSLTKSRAPGAIRQISRGRLRFGTSVSVGQWNLYALHRDGTPKMPKRDPTPSRRKVEKLVREEVMKEFLNRVRW